MVYRRTVVERFAPYANDDGMTMRLTVYTRSDRSSTPNVVYETFSHRADRLTDRVVNYKCGALLRCCVWAVDAVRVDGWVGEQA